MCLSNLLVIYLENRDLPSPDTVISRALEISVLKTTCPMLISSLPANWAASNSYLGQARFSSVKEYMSKTASASPLISKFRTSVQRDTERFHIPRRKSQANSESSHHLHGLMSTRHSYVKFSSYTSVPTYWRYWTCQIYSFSFNSHLDQ